MEIFLLSRFPVITIPGTDEHEINFDATMLEYRDTRYGTATVELLSGSSVQLSPDFSIDSNSGRITTDNPKAVLGIKRGTPLRIKGGAGGEVITVSIIPD